MITSLKEWILFNESLNNIIFDTEYTGRSDWDEILKHESDKFHKEIIYMSPDQFLERVRYKRFKTDYDKVKEYTNTISSAKKLPTPIMWFMSKFQYEQGFAPSWHDGNHRVLALKELGIKEIPVIIAYERNDL